MEWTSEGMLAVVRLPITFSLILTTFTTSALALRVKTTFTWEQFSFTCDFILTFPTSAYFVGL